MLAPPLSRHPAPALSAAAVAAWANAGVAPYFLQVSGGRLRLNQSMGAGDCRNEAISRSSAPFTNVLATDTDAGGMGLQRVG